MTTDGSARQTLFNHLKELGIKTSTLEHDATFSVSQSQAMKLNLPGADTKNLFLKDAKGALFLVIAKSDTRVDLKTLQQKLGAARLSFAKPDLLKEVLGIEPGSVTAFAIINDDQKRVCVVFDANLMAFEQINCHPLENTATTTITRKDLLHFLRVNGFKPMVLELGK